jgi:hypothetical protein
MTTNENQVMTQTELLAAIEVGWNNLQGYLGTLTYEQATIPTDPAGWTVKDHVAHLAVWEDSINTLLDKQDRAAGMRIAPELWASQDYDKINDVIQKRYHDLSLSDLRVMFFSVHERLLLKIQLLSDEELRLPHKVYQPGSTVDIPVIHWIIIDTYQHYAEHITWMDAIAREYSTSVANFLAALQAGWDDLDAFLTRLSERQLTQLTDAAGWTVKDHVIHMAVWEDSMNALLEHQSRQQRMGIDDDTWENGNTDQVNALIQQQHKNLAWDEVQHQYQAIHQRFIANIQALADADLLRPYGDYDSTWDSRDPVLASLVGNSFGHYAEHRPWMETIANQEA